MDYSLAPDWDLVARPPEGDLQEPPKVSRAGRVGSSQQFHAVSSSRTSRTSRTWLTHPFSVKTTWTREKTMGQFPFKIQGRTRSTGGCDWIDPETRKRSTPVVFASFQAAEDHFSVFTMMGD